MKTSFPATHKRIAVVGSVRVSSYFFFALQRFFSALFGMQMILFAPM